MCTFDVFYTDVYYFTFVVPKMYQWQVRNDFNKDVYVYIFVRLMQFFKLNMKDNWEPPVGEIKLWEYRCVFVGILYRYDLITKCFHLNEVMIINILCISFLVGICWEL